MCNLFRKKKVMTVLNRDKERKMETTNSENNLNFIASRVNEVVIDDESNPFKNDKLNRKIYAENLTDVVSVYQEGAVISLNSKWGTGKTTFVKMWKKHLENCGFKTIYYNAWEDDFNDEPLMSLLRALKSSINDDSKLDKVFRAGAKVMAGVLFGAFKAATGGFGTIAGEALNGGLKQLEDSCFDSLKQEDDRVALMNTLRECLMEYVASICDNGKPLVYFVDELDRCCPTFAVKVLERIKHLFDIPNVVFVLSIDKWHLECSVKGFYGNDEIDAGEYLRRFIDIEYNLPDADLRLYCSFLFDYFRFSDFLCNFEREQHGSFKIYEECESFKSAAFFLSFNKHLSLRQIEKVFSVARVGMLQMCYNHYFYPSVYFYLSFLKVCDVELYDKISRQKLDYSELLNAMENSFPDSMFSDNNLIHYDKFFVHNLAVLVLLCYSATEYHSRLNDDGNVKDIVSNYNFVKFDKTLFEKLLIHYSTCIDTYKDITIFTKKIDILGKLQFN